MRRRRILTLVLLLCGFSSAPLFSFEQRAGADLSAFSAPQIGARPLAAAHRAGSHASGGGPGHRAGFGTGMAMIAAPDDGAVRWGPAGPRPSANRRICPSGVRLTYHANAPPTDAVST